MEKLEEYINSLEDLIFASWKNADISNLKVREAANSLWEDISRYGPQIPNLPKQVHIPGLGDFELPPNPPPPPPRAVVQPAGLYEQTASWISHNPRKTAGIAVGTVGTALLVGYGRVYLKAQRLRRLKASVSDRRQVVVVLGGDTPYALPLILDLERKGYIVVCSVSDADAAHNLETQCRGYVRALLLDPASPESIPIFLRSLSSALSRRFPINSSGDPFVSPASLPHIHSIISLLSATPPQSLRGPLEHISFDEDYLSYLRQTQITPLSVIQAMLPMLRTSPSRGDKSIVICLPATPSRVGLPFSGIESMSAASTLRAAEVLRREIAAAALTGKADAMKHFKVVVVEVGTLTGNVSVNGPEEVYKAMDGWTASEKLAYGPAFASIHVSPKDHGHYGIPRRPTDVNVLVNSLVGVVSNGRLGSRVVLWNRFRNWLRGDRFSVGAGAYTYALASYLPPVVLNTLLNVPHWLIGLRNRLLPVQPYIRPDPAARLPSRVPPASEQGDSSNNEHYSDEAGSEADVESNNDPGHDQSAVEGSWVSLRGEEANVW